MGSPTVVEKNESKFREPKFASFRIRCGIVFGALAMAALAGCGSPQASDGNGSSENDRRALTMMSLTGGDNSEFETRVLAEFEGKRHHQFRYMPAFESDLDRLEVYQGLFRDRSSQPDISEIDIIWPAILADDLVDLSPTWGMTLRPSLRS